jgi:hypothetical protein
MSSRCTSSPVGKIQIFYFYQFALCLSDWKCATQSEVEVHSSIYVVMIWHFLLRIVIGLPQDVFKKWHYHENPCTWLLTKVAKVMKVFGRTLKRSIWFIWNLNFCFQNWFEKKFELFYLVCTVCYIILYPPQKRAM